MKVVSKKNKQKKNHNNVNKTNDGVGAVAEAAATPASTVGGVSAAVIDKTKVNKISPEQLWADLQEHNLFFDDLVDMIPSKLYVSQLASGDGGHYGATSASNKYYKGQSKDSKETRRALNKQSKRLKLDPTTHETTTQLKQRLELQENQQLQQQGSGDGGSGGRFSTNLLPRRSAAAGRGRQQQRHHQDDDGDDGDSNDDVDENNGTSETTTTRNTEKIQNEKNSGTKAVTMKEIATTSESSNSNSSRIEELRAKIQAKLAEKRGQRPSDPATVSKIAARRAEKKKRKQEMKSNGGKGTNKKQDAKRNKKSAISRAEDKASGGSSSLYNMIDSARNNKIDDPAADLARVDFGRLAGLNTQVDTKSSTSRSNNYNETNKALKNLSKTKNLEKMLADAEAKRQRLKELQQSTDDTDRQKAKNIQWGDAIREASGERVKDDPAKIKKLMKRKAASKAKSAKAWKSRMEQTQQKMQERQKIRTHNLQKRKQGGTAGANLSSKRINNNSSDGGAGGKDNKKPKLNRPGFEGRKLEFLNPKKSQ